MAINLVRKPSETPNINNHDDYRMFRYATGGYNGVVEKYGNECDYEIVGNTFKIKSGEIVIDGVQSKIDSVGVELTVDNVTGTEYYTVYCEVNLSLIGNQKVEIKSTKNTVNYPAIEKGDDLTEVQTGIARLELYRFTASSGVISNVVKKFEIIEVRKVLNAEFAKYALNAEFAKYASDDIEKGTIEERLTSLGFRQGSVRFSGGSTTRLTRQGNYVVWTAFFNNGFSSPVSGTLCTLPFNFRPATTITLTLGGRGRYIYNGYLYSNRICICTMTVNGNDAGIDAGKVILTTPVAQYGIHSNGGGIIDINCAMNTANWQIGFEAPPIV